VVDDHDAVARKMNVELEAVRAEGQPVIERRQRILRAERGAAAMRIDEGAREQGVGQRDRSYRSS
jgi:hypothetical protein